MLDVSATTRGRALYPPGGTQVMRWELIGQIFKDGDKRLTYACHLKFTDL
jgi:hypothetical protein